MVFSGRVLMTKEPIDEEKVIRKGTRLLTEGIGEVGERLASTLQAEVFPEFGDKTHEFSTSIRLKRKKIILEDLKVWCPENMILLDDATSNAYRAMGSLFA